MSKVSTKCLVSHLWTFDFRSSFSHSLLLWRRRSILLLLLLLWLLFLSLQLLLLRSSNIHGLLVRADWHNIHIRTISVKAVHAMEILVESWTSRSNLKQHGTAVSSSRSTSASGPLLGWYLRCDILDVMCHSHEEGMARTDGLFQFVTNGKTSFERARDCCLWRQCLPVTDLCYPAVSRFSQAGSCQEEKSPGNGDREAAVYLSWPTSLCVKNCWPVDALSLSGKKRQKKKKNHRRFEKWTCAWTAQLASGVFCQLALIRVRQEGGCTAGRAGCTAGRAVAESASTSSRLRQAFFSRDCSTWAGPMFVLKR